MVLSMTGVSSGAAVPWYQYFRDICSWKLVNSPTKPSSSASSLQEPRSGRTSGPRTAFQTDGRHQRRHGFVASRRTHVAPAVRIHRKAGVLEYEAPHRRALSALSLIVATKNTGSFQSHPHTTKTPHRLWLHAQLIAISSISVS